MHSFIKSYTCICQKDKGKERNIVYKISELPKACLCLGIFHLVTEVIYRMQLAAKSLRVKIAIDKTNTSNSYADNGSDHQACILCVD